MRSTEASQVVLFSVLSVFLPQIAVAQPQTSAAHDSPELTPSPANRLHRGLYLSVAAGIGDLHVTYYDYTIAGRTHSLDVALGLAAASNLVVFGELYQASVLSPVANEHPVFSVGLHGFGAGVKYYVLSANIFLSGSLLLCQLSKSEDNYDTPSYWGAGGRFSIGKEWWVSPSWSLGLTGEVVLARMRNNPSASRPEYQYEYNAQGVSLLFSANLSYPPSYSPGEPVKPTPASSVGYHTHDGFFLNALLGLGWLGMKSGDLSLSGMGVPLGISAGFAARSNLVVFGELYRATVSDPDSSGYLVDLQFYGFGPGLKYYLMPINVFFSGSLLVSEMRFHDRYPGDYRGRDAIDARSDWGFTGHLSAGKEWWVSPEWGLGIASEVLLGRMSGPGSPWTLKGGSLVLSASFN